MHDEDDLLPLSGLQHMLYCPRQWALIHLEMEWEDNQWTAEGKEIHRRCDTDEVEVRPGIRIARGLYIQSRRLGLSGRADVVEFIGLPPGPGPVSPEDAHTTTVRVVPVEYKRGRPKKDDWDRVQVCAQALCLEEMLGVRIENAALFYAKTRRRETVPLDAALREKTEALAVDMHRLYRARCTPACPGQPARPGAAMGTLRGTLPPPFHPAPRPQEIPHEEIAEHTVCEHAGGLCAPRRRDTPGEG
jgi:CRISPR-associated exonuclease Cas4